MSGSEVSCSCPKIVAENERLREELYDVKKKQCYQCDAKVHELSRRSRCVRCECHRGDFNETENDKVREELHILVTWMREVQAQACKVRYASSSATHQQALSNMMTLMDKIERERPSDNGSASVHVSRYDTHPQ